MDSTTAGLIAAREIPSHLRRRVAARRGGRLLGAKERPQEATSFIRAFLNNLSDT